MSDNKNSEDADREAMLAALEQLSETMAAMNRVVNRLRRTVEHAQETAVANAQTASASHNLANRKTTTDGDIPLLDTPVVLH